MNHFGFILEQTLGHITHTQNLKKNIALDPEFTAHWALIPWEAHGLAGRLPLYRSNWTLRAGLRARRALSRLSREARLDALFFHTQVPAVLAQDWLRRIPGVVSLDATPRQYDSLGDVYAHAKGPEWLERVKWRLNRDCFHAARRLVTWSEWARDGLVDEYAVPAGKITVIPPGVNTRAWASPGIRRPPGPVKILFVGADLQRKGGLLLLDACRRLRQRSPVGPAGPAQEHPVELHLVTRSPIPAEPGVFVYNHLQPNSAELKQLYFDSHIFCLPTYGDCLPMVLSEAGAAGLPAVSTRVAAIPEIVGDGETGFLVPPGDGGALTAALQRLVDDPDLRERMGAQAVRRVAQGFDAERNALRLVDLLKQVASERRGAGTA